MAVKKSNLRDKYKPVKLSDLKKKVKDEDSIVGSSGNSEFLEITDGQTNKFRLLPPHQGADYYVVRKRYWLSLEGDGGDAVRRTVLDARVHGGMKKDIVDEYVKWCTKNNVNKEAMAKINDWKDGLKPQHDFIAYAVKISKDSNEFGLLSFKKTVRDAINKATFIEDDDEPIEVDPFTDIDNGLPLLIKYNAKPNKKKGEDFYDVQVGKKAIAIDDDSLTKFDSAKSLIELYRNVYSASMFETALEGLRYFDAEQGVDAFDDDTWLEIVEELRSELGDSSEEEDEKPIKKTSKPTSKKKVVAEEEDEDEEEDEEEDDDSDDEDEETEEGDDLDEMDRSELKAFIKEKKLSVVVKSSMDEDDIRELIKDAMNESEEEEDEEADEEEEDEEDEKPAAKSSSKKMSMDDIRNRLKSKKK